MEIGEPLVRGGRCVHQLQVDARRGGAGQRQLHQPVDPEDQDDEGRHLPGRVLTALRRLVLVDTDSLGSGLWMSSLEVTEAHRQV